jgi:hypothetical protein
LSTRDEQETVTSFHFDIIVVALVVMVISWWICAGSGNRPVDAKAVTPGLDGANLRVVVEEPVVEDGDDGMLRSRVIDRNVLRQKSEVVLRKEEMQVEPLLPDVRLERVAQPTDG